MTLPEKATAPSGPHWLLSPWTIFAGVILGCAIGLLFKGLAERLTFFADVFLSLIQMCVIPIIVTAIISSLGRLVARQFSTRFLSRLVLIFAGGLIFASLVGLSAGTWAKPGADLNENARGRIGEMIAQYETGTIGRNDAPSHGLLGFLKEIVPSNVFGAFSQGKMLSILFFCILFGISLGLVRTQAGRVTLFVMEALYDAFQTMFGWVMYVLPFGLCVLFAAQISHIGLTIFATLIKFIVVVYLTCVLMMLLYTVLIWWRRRGALFAGLSALREPLIVALGTSSSYAATPSALRCLQENLRVKKGASNLVIPLGVNLHPQGQVMYFVLAIILIAQIYHVSLGVQGIIIMLVGSIVAAMGTAGVPGAGSLSILALVLAPLGLPAQTAIVLLIAIDPLIDPVLTVVNVFGNCMAAVWAEESDR
ncbi:MAG: dicarboxylate/amino acid:cation symporter [Candidatus Omnitrophica bacterium]|nr:dicarboxylate/amino acid:cation symporter [Candidatus Omnitrophota bacterium]